jgi:hypothetical protein
MWFWRYIYIVVVVVVVVVAAKLGNLKRAWKLSLWICFLAAQMAHALNDSQAQKTANTFQFRLTPRARTKRIVEAA